MLFLLPLCVSLGVAGCVVVLLDSFITRQNRHRWLVSAYSLPGFKNQWMSLCNWLIHTLSLPLRDVEKKLIQAGIYNKTLARLFFPAKVVGALLLGGGLFLLGEQFGLTVFYQRLSATSLVAVLVILVPDMLLAARCKKRIQHVSGQLPYLLDLMAVCVQTGMTIEASIAYLGEELECFDRDLAYLMRRTASVSRVAGIHHGLQDLKQQLPSRDMQSFVYTLSQSLRYGSSLFEVLTTQADNLRKVGMLTLEERVAKLSAKISVPLILLIMFPLVILMTAPGILRMMSHA